MGCIASGRDQPKWLMPPDRHRDIARGYPRHPETGSLLEADVLESVETSTPQQLRHRATQA
jgi:hypothetical protein